MVKLTLLLNLMAFFTISGMVLFLLICIFLFDYLKYKAFRRNKGVGKYLRRRR
jgi:hypothetical protein